MISSNWWNGITSASKPSMQYSINFICGGTVWNQDVENIQYACVHIYRTKALSMLCKLFVLFIPEIFSFKRFAKIFKWHFQVSISSVVFPWVNLSTIPQYLLWCAVTCLRYLLCISSTGRPENLSQRIRQLLNFQVCTHAAAVWPDFQWSSVFNLISEYTGCRSHISRAWLTAVSDSVGLIEWPGQQ